MFTWPAVAVIAILLAVRFLGARAVPRFRTPDDVRTLLAVEHPEIVPVAIAVTTDGLAALVDPGASDHLAVAFVTGNQQATRELVRGDIAGIHVLDEEGPDRDVVIAMHDVGFPALKLRLDEPTWRSWEPRLKALVGAMAFLIVPALGAAQSMCGVVTIEPPMPRPGSFFHVTVEGEVGSVAGEAFGEPLHFAVDSARKLRALAGAPIDAGLDGLVHLTCGADSALVPVRLERADYPTEQLRVNRQFVDRPDSALAARIARESARAAAVARASHGTPRLWREPYQRPRSSRVTSGYGRARMFNGTVQSRHLGTDFAGSIGAPVRAVNRGVVRIVAAFYYGGRVIYIDHGEGVTTAYLHLSRQQVVEGDTVARGQVIGGVGATGRVTGPHLHLIARYGSHSLDPLTLVRPAARPRPAS